jgi:hypothetical protein
LAPELKPSQTPQENPEQIPSELHGASRFSTGHAFGIILPNLTRKSKKRNLPHRVAFGDSFGASPEAPPRRAGRAGKPHGSRAKFSGGLDF